MIALSIYACGSPELYEAAAALGLDFEPGFADFFLRQRVAQGLCDGRGVLSVVPREVCSGCRACSVRAALGAGAKHGMHRLHAEVSS